MSYTGSYKGIPYSSNVDPNVDSGPGHYQYTINFSVPFANVIAEYGLDIAQIFDSNFVAQIMNQSGSTVTNFSASTSGNSLVIQYDATSPGPLLVMGLIIAALAVISFLVVGIGLFFTPSGHLILTAGSIAIIALVAGGGLLLAYSFLKSPQTRQNVVRAGERATAYLSAA